MNEILKNKQANYPVHEIVYEGEVVGKVKLAPIPPSLADTMMQINKSLDKGETVLSPMLKNIMEKCLRDVRNPSKAYCTAKELDDTFSFADMMMIMEVLSGDMNDSLPTRAETEDVLDSNPS